MSEIAAGVGDWSRVVVLGERTQLYWGDPAIVLHIVSGVETSRCSVALSRMALCVGALGAMVWGLTGVEAWMSGGSAGHCPGTRLALKCCCSQAAGTRTVWNSLRTEAAARLLHDLWPLSWQHTSWTRVSYEVIDAEHAALSSSKAWR